MRRTLIEFLYIAAGVIVSIVLAKLSAWAVPLAAGTIWKTAYAAMLIVVVLGIAPLRRAWRADHGVAEQRSIDG